MSSKKLASIAQLLWCCSLALPGFATYSSSGAENLGFLILLAGWLSPFVLNLAWYANPLFWYAISKLESDDEPPVVSSILAVLLSLDMFSAMFHSFSNESVNYIRGYGWGAILWLLSIFLLLMAVGAKQQEQRKSLDITAGQDFLGALGFLLFTVTFTATTYFSIHDRMVANQAELKNLEGLAFKLGTVCQLPDPIVKQPIHNFSGVLKVIANTPDDSVKKVKDLLTLGIPVVRVADRDYSLAANTEELLSTPASGVASATLHMDMNAINATLVETATNRVVFNQHWQREQVTHLIFVEKYKELLIGNPNNYCPDFSQQPERLLIQALNLPETKAQPQKNKLQREVELKGVLIEDKKKLGHMEKTDFSNKSFLSDSELRNSNCANDIELDNHSLPNRYDSLFKIKDRVYNLERRFDFATCEGNFVYLYSSGFRNGGEYFLHVEKRTLPDFSQKWTRFIVISDSRVYRNNKFRLQSVKEKQNSMTVELVKDTVNNNFPKSVRGERRGLTSLRANGSL